MRRACRGQARGCATSHRQRPTAPSAHARRRALAARRTVEGIYLAAEEATVWAEWYRWLAELEIEPLRGLPRELWRYRASLSSVADLTSTETLAALGLPTAVPSRDQWPLFQDVGEQLHAADCDGLLYYSAARPGDCACACSAPTRPRRRDGLSRSHSATGEQTAGATAWTTDLILGPHSRERNPLSALPRSARSTLLRCSATRGTC